MLQSRRAAPSTACSLGTQSGLRRSVNPLLSAMIFAAAAACQQGKELILPTAPPDPYNFATTRLVMHSACTFAVEVYATNHGGYSTAPMVVVPGQTVTMNVVQVGDTPVDLIVTKQGAAAAKTSVRLTTGGYPTTGLTINLPCPQ